MNIIKISILYILLCGCAINKYPEGILTKTKVYCGQLTDIQYNEKTSVIHTTMIIFEVKGNPDILKGSHCYIRREICYQDVTKSIKNRLEVKYLSWNNSKEYRVKGNIPHKLFIIK